MTGYLLLTKGDASFALKGACVMIRASQVSRQTGSAKGQSHDIPAVLVEEKVLVLFFNALESYNQVVRSAS